MPKVSVLMSVYNKRPFVAPAIESVLSQTLTDWELIVVDDGSTDGSERVLQRYAPRFAAYVTQENQGLARAMNRAFRHARGEYIALLGADDAFLPDALRTLSAYLDQHPLVGLVDSDGYVVDERGDILDRLSAYRRHSTEGEWLDCLLVSPSLNIGDTALTRRSWLERMDGPFDEAMSGYEDWDLVLRLAAAGCTMAVIDNPTCNYRVNRSQKSSPHSPLAPGRQRSLHHFVRKTLNSAFFETASPGARYEFLRSALVTHSGSNLSFQEEVLGSRAFQALSPEQQAGLLYRVGLDNLVFQRAGKVGQSRLAEARALRAADVKVRAVSALARRSPGMLALAVRCYHKARTLRPRPRNAPKSFVPGRATDAGTP